jgi:hypothetical protein
MSFLIGHDFFEQGIYGCPAAIDNALTTDFDDVNVWQYPDDFPFMAGIGIQEQARVKQGLDISVNLFPA